MKFDLVAHIKEMFAWLQQHLNDVIGWLFSQPLD